MSDLNQKQTPEIQNEGIPSVNNRGGSGGGNMIGKIVFVFLVIAALVIAGLIGFNKYRAAQKSKEASTELDAKNVNKPAAVGHKREFESDPPPLPGHTGAAGATADAASGQAAPAAAAACADGMPGTVVIGQDSKPLMSPAGAPVRVCKDGRMIVPAVAGQPGQQAAGQPLAVNGTQGQQTQGGTPPPSRYSGEVMLPNSTTTQQAAANQLSPATQTSAQMLQAILAQKAQAAQAGSTSLSSFQQPGGGGGGAGGQQPASPPGSLGSQLAPSQTPTVSASMLGNRNMILPKGRTIDCAMSMKLVNEVAGMATCVLSQNVYSDNGRVLLLERGSEAQGEYQSAMAMGQRRIFVLWNRIKTPKGVVININSPAADGLGTSGLSGYVDNHWWDRIGAAFLLSTVQDAIAYETAKATGSNGATGVAVFQNTAQTGNNMAQKVLESTINIKPTIFKNQGDRGSIFVARDLDFGTVYDLRAR